MNQEVADCFKDIGPVRTPKRKMCEITVKNWHPLDHVATEERRSTVPCHSHAAFRFIAAYSKRCKEVRICHVTNSGKNECVTFFSCKQAKDYLAQEYPQD